MNNQLHAVAARRQSHARASYEQPSEYGGSLTLLSSVAERVSHGGHAVPDAVVRRRFAAGLENFENLYKVLVDAWVLYDNAGEEPRQHAEAIAIANNTALVTVIDGQIVRVHPRLPANDDHGDHRK